MRKIYFLLYVLFLMLISFSAYQLVEAKWVRFRYAEMLFNKGEYVKAYEYYVSSIKHGFSSDKLFNHLGECADVIGDYNPIYEVYKRLIIDNPNDNQVYIDLALFFAKFRQEDKAISYFNSLLKSDSNPIIYLVLGRMHSRVREYGLSIDNFEKYLSSNPDVQVSLELANIYNIADKKEKAKELLEELINEKPDLIIAKLLLADILIDQDEIVNATEILQNVDLDDIEDQSELVLASLYLKQNEYVNAKNIIKKYLKREHDNISARYILAEILERESKYNQSIDQYEKILDYYNDFQIRRKLGRIYFIQCNYKKSEEEFKKSLKTIDYSIVPKKNRISDFDTKILLAKSYINNNDPKNALLILYPLLEEYNNNLDVHVLLYQAYFEENKYEKSLEQIQIIKKSLKDEDSKKLEGKIYLAQKNYQKALEIFKEYPPILPEDSNLLEGLANAYLWELNYQGAIDIYLALIRKEPDNISWMEKLADIYSYNGKYFESIYYYLKILKEKPDDTEIERKLALTYSNNNDFKKAIPILKKLFEKNYKDKLVGLELSKNYLNEKKYSEAQKVVNTLYEYYPNDPSVIKSEFYIYYAQGLLLDAKNFYIQKENFLRLKDKAELLIKLNNYPEADKCYLTLLNENPDDLEINLLLGELYTAMKRYNESEGIFSYLLYKKKDVKKIYIDYANLKNAETEFNDAENLISQAMVIFPNDSDLLWEKASILRLKRNEFEAVKIYEELLDDNLYRKKALITLGKIYFTKDIQKARLYFQKALDDDPNLIEAQFYLCYPCENPINFFDNMTAQELVIWASLYHKYKNNEQAYILFKKALDKNASDYSARMGLVYLYMSEFDYKRAIYYIDQLLIDFPNNYNLLLEKASILSWIRDFYSAIKEYEILRDKDPNNPEIIKDIARVYSWDQDIKKAESMYNLALSPSVDEILLKKDPELFPKQIKFNDIPYYYYEKIKSDVDSGVIKNKETINVVFKLYGLYRVQKSIYLEKMAILEYEKHYFVHAKHYFEELVDFKSVINAKNLYLKNLEFEPWNEEALFDLAQCYCHFGLCNLSIKYYKKLLQKNVHHSLAEEAYKLNKIKNNIAVSPRYRFFREQGRGELDRITQNKVILPIQIPMNCKNLLSIGGVFWNDRPNFPKATQVKNENSLAKSYYSYGFKIDWNQILNEFVRIHAGVEQKHYIDDFSDRTSGYFHLFLNAYDYIHFQTLFDQDNKIDNYFGLKHGTQFRRLLIKTHVPIQRIIDIDSNFRFYYFNDSNRMQYHNLHIDLNLVTNPVLFKISVNGEYRDTKKQNVYIYDGDDLVDIIYPYWTPSEYWAYRVAIGLIKDFSVRKYCGNESRYYMIDVRVGNDTENNPAVIVDALWHCEFYKHWSIDIKGLIHRSSLWNSEDVKAELKYRF